MNHLIKLKDRVRIINPSPGQQHEGLIVGITKDKLLKLKIDSGNVVRRIPRNLHTLV